MDDDDWGWWTKSRSSSMGYNMDLMMMTMMMLVVVVREDASIFINRRRWCLVFCLTFIRIFSKDIDDDGGDSGWKTVAPVYNWWSFGLTDPFLYCFFANDSLHHRITDRVHQRDGASVWASLTASLSLRPSTTLCFPQIPHIIIIFLQELLCIQINSHMIYHLFLQLSSKWPKSNEPKG